MAVLTTTPASMPAAVGPLCGVPDNANSNGDNSVAYVTSNGAGAGDTIANAELLKGLSTNSRMYAFLSRNFASQADLDAAAAALGFNASVMNGSMFHLVREAVGGPSATLTGVAGQASVVRLSLSQSFTR